MWQTSGFVCLLSVDSTRSLCVRTTTNLTGLHKFTENSEWISQTEEDGEVKLGQSSLSDGERRSPQHPAVQHASFIWVLPLAPSPVCQTVYESGKNRPSKVKLRLTVERDSWSCLRNSFFLFFVNFTRGSHQPLTNEGGSRVKDHRAEFKCRHSTEGFFSSHSTFHADDTTVQN